MALLDSITSPQQLRTLSDQQLAELASEIRQFLITKVTKTGGHLGPNLGVVELTIALHLVFDSPTDPIIFDTGHQSYVHKILTGRAAGFDHLRQKDGLSGYPSRAESEHDWLENSHASAALSWAEGLARGFQLAGQSNRHVATVVGDGALTGGMVWEALNNIAVAEDLPLVIVVNDNGRSYSPTIGGLSRYLADIRTDPRYEQTLGQMKQSLQKSPLGKQTYELLHGLKAGLKDVLAPQGLFSDLGLKYLGPIDGHDIGQLVTALKQAKGFGGPVIVHAITHKGRGYQVAEKHEVDLFHSVGKIDELTGAPIGDAGKRTWTDAFAAQITKLADEDPKLVGLTAAMLHPVGLGEFAKKYPKRVFDVGIAEQHAMTFAAGLAKSGLHPVFCVYATFLNRAFDQLVMDAGLHKVGMTIVLDRAGLTGSDGASHNGVWDVAIAGLVPGARIAAPRDETRLAEALADSVANEKQISVLRYSKGELPAELVAKEKLGSLDLLYGDPADSAALLVAWGSMCEVAVQAAELLDQEGISVCVVDPVWALPISHDLVELAGQFGLVVTLEDDLVVNGLGAQLQTAANQAQLALQLCQIGVPKQYLPTASRAQLLAEFDMTPVGVVKRVKAALNS